MKEKSILGFLLFFYNISKEVNSIALNTLKRKLVVCGFIL